MNESSRFAPVAPIGGREPYSTGPSRTPCDLRLDANEGRPWFDPGRIAAAGDDLCRYPDPRGIEARLAEHFGVEPARLLATAGADDGIDRACRAMLGPGRELVLPTPTFVMIERYAALTGARVRTVAWPGGPYPTEAVVEAIGPRTAMVAVVSPNNPTGAVATAEDLRRLASAAPHALLLVDLAYAEFADEDLTAAALALPNAIVLRTFSKAWGMAGLRVGAALGAPEPLRWMRTAGHPYPISTLSARIVGIGLDADPARRHESIARARTERARLSQLLAGLGARPEPSQGNFVFARVVDAERARADLAGLGVAVRAFAGEGALRITCPADPHDLQRLERALRTVFDPRALLFDMDGVLADSSGSYDRTVIETARSFGVEVDRPSFEAAVAAGGANDDWELTRRLLAEAGVEIDYDEVRVRFESIYQGERDRPGTHESERLLVPRPWLVALADRMPLAVVTGRPRRDALRFLERFGLASCFRAVVAREDAPALKPDPRPVTRALDVLGVERAWMVGDTPDDVRAARAAGVVPLGIVAPGVEPVRRTEALLRAGAGRVLRRLEDLSADLEALR